MIGEVRLRRVSAESGPAWARSLVTRWSEGKTYLVQARLQALPEGDPLRAWTDMCFVRETSPRRSQAVFGRPRNTPGVAAPRGTAAMWFAMDQGSNTLSMNQRTAVTAAEIGYTTTLNGYRTQARYLRANTPRPLTVILPAPVSALYRAEVFRILRRYGACASLARLIETQKHGGQEVSFGGSIRLTAVLAPDALAPVETFHQQPPSGGSDEFSFITERVNAELYALWIHFQGAAGAAPTPFVIPAPGLVGMIRPPPVAVAAQNADDDLLARLTAVTQTPPTWMYVENGNDPRRRACPRARSLTIAEQVGASPANEDEDDEDEEPAPTDRIFDDSGYNGDAEDDDDSEDEALRLAREAIRRRPRPPDFLAGIVDTLVARRNGNG